MANKQRGPLPPVLSTEETRVKPPEEDEDELPPEDPSWDPQRDSTQLLPNTAPVPLADEGDDATPPVPRKIDPVFIEDPSIQGPDEATRNIPRKTGARPALQVSDDATRPIPRKTGARPALQDDDATRNIPRKSSIRPALQDDDATRNIPRKSGSHPTVQDDATRNIPRKSGPHPTVQNDDATRNIPRKSSPTVTRTAPPEDAPLPWETGQDDLSRLPTRAGPLPPIVSGPEQALVYPPGGPPVLVPVNTEPHYLAQAPRVEIITQPNYVPPPPPAVTPVVTAPHLIPAPQPMPPGEAPPEGELRTTFSNKAALVADLVKATFARRSYGTLPYRLRIDEPDGPSTAGGLHARQPISLVSNLDSAPAIVVGWVDVAKKEAQLRTYGAVVRRHHSRYTNGLDITEAEYDQFLNELVETLFYGGIKILLVVPDEPEPAPTQGSQAQAQAQPQPAGRSCLGTLFLLSLTFALGLGVGMNSEALAPFIAWVKALIP